MINLREIEFEKFWGRKRYNVYLNLFFYISEHLELLNDKNVSLVYDDVCKVYYKYMEFHLSAEKDWVCPKWNVNEEEAKVFLDFFCDVQKFY